MTQTQMAALPVTIDQKGDLRILMITSRDTGRWVLPKGWPMKGKNLRRAAEQEAMEEAGVIGEVSKKPIGVYHYTKRMEKGDDIPCEVILFPLKVKKLLRSWPERDERKRKWFSPKGAAKRVDEEDLRAILSDIKTEELALAL
ncbi:MAG: NUDIX hydrolase [Hyphomicrobiales bacterium]|nr:NUDIX hydrolase [Hyphomicrobiales bacterium]PCJ90496.1 MAG: NUDIX hydrolase [Hyphomicrobiales bacterium]